MKNKIKSLTKSILLKIPYINTKIKRYTYINKVILDAGYEPGHYYSTVPKLDDLKKNQDIIFQEKEIKDIDFNEEHQLKNLDEIKDFYKDGYFNHAGSGKYFVFVNSHYSTVGQMAYIYAHVTVKTLY